MRIVHAVRSDAFAGVERHVAVLAGAQAALGHDVVVAGGDPAAVAAAVRRADVRVLPVRSTPDLARTLHRYARGADVLHVHMTAAEVAATLATTLVPGAAPVVATRHFARTRGSGPARPVTAAVARHRVTAQIAISEYVARHVDGASTVVPVGVPDQPDAPGAPERERVVLVLQRLEAEKRTDLALRAFAASGLADRGWRLDVVGDGALRPRLEAQAVDAGLARSVRFLGRRDDVESIMRRSAVLLAPCAVEGLGLSVLEAMASGLPVVAAAAGGHLETLRGLDPLALHTPDDADAAAHQLATLAADPERRTRYGEAAQRAQRARFTPRAQAVATQSVYDGVLRGPR